MGRRDATTDYYEITQSVVRRRLVAGLGEATLWAYNGSVPGPTIRQRQGRDVRIRQRNRLPVTVSVHLHGGDVPADSDGHPLDLIPPGGSRDYLYPGIHPPAPLWYHDHAIHETGRNVYMGLAGQYHIGSAAEDELNLPQNPYDIPLTIQDRLFLPDGQISYPRHDEERPMRQGVFGDVILVNGAPKPFFPVRRRKYRFRILNGSNARVYRLRLSTGEPFSVITGEGGFLPAPVETVELEISPSERYGVVLDFARYRPGTKVIMRNVMDDVPGDPFDEDATREVMRCDVVGGPVRDSSEVPSVLLPSEDVDPAEAVAVRKFRFDRSGGAWTINNRLWDPDRIDARARLGTVEIWEFENHGGGWWHPIHPHLVEFRALDRSRRPLEPYERGPKDMILLRDCETARVAMRWNHFPGRYVMHCHNVEHEDHDMMLQFQVV
jgi:spore coat protein A, manganese oxidase